jgi:hypothetical protein
MTPEQLAQIFTASGFTPEQLGGMLSRFAMLDKRENLRASMAKERAAQSVAVQQSEAAIQALQAQFDAIEAQLAAQS